jgi:antirestriction protein ArdC
MKPCTVNDNAQDDQSPKQDIYARITAKIVAALEGGVRPWVRPWNAAHAAGRISRPLRYNGQPYAGINVLALWTSASVQGFAAPIWMTYRQAVELDAHVRKGEKGSSVVYANSITRTETDTDSGVDVARDIHFLRGYTVFNVEQIDGLPVLDRTRIALGARLWHQAFRVRRLRDRRTRGRARRGVPLCRS